MPPSFPICTFSWSHQRRIRFEREEPVGGQGRAWERHLFRGVQSFNLFCEQCSCTDPIRSIIIFTANNQNFIYLMKRALMLEEGEEIDVSKLSLGNRAAFDASSQLTGYQTSQE